MELGFESSIKQKKWSEVRAGDIVKVLKNEEVPADMLCINGPKDIVYISTMNLDGETNLKERAIALDNIDEANIKEFNGHIVCDMPCESLELWNGNVHSPLLDKVTNCSMKNMILRGCTLKNSEYCYGIAIYVGGDSKIMRNAK